MFDIPPSPIEKSDLSCCSEEVKSFLMKQHDKMTIRQMRSVISYLENKISSLQNGVEDSLTIEDFEKVKKVDVDNDGEEGEL